MPWKYLAIFYLLVLVAGSVIPFSRAEVLSHTYVLEVRGDYVVHLALYLPLPFLLFRAFFIRGFLRRNLVLGSSLLVIPCLLEFVQLYIPGRYFNVNDLVSNIAGVILGVIVIFLLPRSWRSEHSTH